MNVTQWLEEIKSARKREKDFRKEGEKILEIYENEQSTPFNILYSNTETLLPALFSQMPRPVIRRRHPKEDPTALAVSTAAQRMLEYLLDTDVDEYEDFEEAITSATLDGLLPGRGMTSVKYESDDSVSWESVCPDSRVWNRVYFGYAKKWSRVPWVAYEEYLDKAEVERLFGAGVAAKLTFTEGQGDDEDDDNDSHEEDQGLRKTALIYQVWDKDSKKVLWIAPQYKDDFLRKDDDPLGLSGFFNCPKPIQFVLKPHNLTPTALFKLYENQAEELNRIQGRLNKVIEAIKVRGVYNGQIATELENLLKENDNALVPTDSSTTLMDGGLEKNIWFLPIEKLVAVAQQLILARESAKRVIYEITGISDIVRGQSVASETLGAQKIKASWGTMRLKRLQKEVQRYALDLMELMLDVAAKKFSETSWAKMTGLAFTTTEQKTQAQNALRAMQGQIQQIQMQVHQQTQYPDQQAQQQPPDPQILQQLQQQMQQAQEVLKAPYWPDVLQVMKDEFTRSYRVDIETNSTLDVEATEDKQMVGDFMNAMAQFLNGVGPLLQDQILPFGAAKSILLAITRRYRFGDEVEQELQSMQPPKPPQDPKMAQEKKKLEDDRQKFEQERRRAGEILDKQAMDNTKEKMQLEFEKKLAALEQKHREELASKELGMRETEILAAVKSQGQRNKADLQSMLDKHIARIEKMQAVMEAHDQPGEAA